MATTYKDVTCMYVPVCICIYASKVAFVYVLFK